MVESTSAGREVDGEEFSGTGCDSSGSDVELDLIFWGSGLELFLETRCSSIIFDNSVSKLARRGWEVSTDDASVFAVSLCVEALELSFGGILRYEDHGF